VPSPIPIRRRESLPAADPLEQLRERIAGQDAALRELAPYVRMFQAGLAPEGRPAGVFLLLGPTGTGKTRTVEALAEALHGSERNVVRIDCGEYQMEHEVAKLIGAPPGYLGHRETQPALTQARLLAVTTERCGLSLVLFDEIEKAAPSLTRLLLGVLDRGILKLGDNTTVNFERSFVFLTSNLGARGMLRALRPDFGFEALAGAPRGGAARLERLGMAAVRRKFSPEFVNRLDRVITYRPLSREALERILDLQLERIRQHTRDRLAERAFEIEVPPEVRDWLLREGTSVEFGARELKRTLLRHVLQPLAALLLEGAIAPGATAVAEVREDGLRWRAG
jgi:ATP-dependent Clp protease ATP-binding subunit ClpA